jgi:hypothetical protein
MVRARAFAALGQIRAATATACQAEPWRVAGRFQQSIQNGWRRVQVEVSSSDGRQQIHPLPTHFILSEDGLTVASYTVEERLAPESLSIAFVLPRQADNTSLNEGILDAMRWKRPSDLWTCAPYIPTPRKLQATVLGEDIRFAVEEHSPNDGLPLAYSCDPATVEAMFRKVPACIECTDLWNGIRRAVMLEGGPARGHRHVIVYSQHETDAPPGYAGIASMARTANVTLHAISLAAIPLLENLCQLTQGTAESAASEEEVPNLVERICHNLIARYTIRYQPVEPAADELAIRVQSSAGWGETTIPVPRQR